MITRFNIYDEYANAYRDDSGDYMLYSDHVEAQQAAQQLITQLVEALQGLRQRHGCWCELPPNPGSPDHTAACEAATVALAAATTPTQTQPAGEG